MSDQQTNRQMAELISMEGEHIQITSSLNGTYVAMKNQSEKGTTKIDLMRMIAASVATLIRLAESIAPTPEQGREMLILLVNKHNKEILDGTINSGVRTSDAEESDAE